MTTSIENIKNTLNAYNELCNTILRLVTLYENNPDFVFIYFTEVSVTETKIKAEYQYMLGDSYKDGVIWFPYDLLNKSDEDAIEYFK